MDLPKVVSIEQTCGACPSQWEGRLDDGRGLYVRYRYGKLKIALFDGADYVSAPNETIQHIVVWESDNEWDGVMESSEMIGRTKLLLDWSMIDGYNLNSWIENGY